MAWFTHALVLLSQGQEATVVPHGNSMMPRIHSGALVKLSPLTDTQPEVDDAVLVRVKGTVYVHLVKAIQGTGDDRRYLIGNNHGGINGWTNRKNVYGVVTEVSKK